MTTTIVFSAIALTTLLAGAIHVPVHGRSFRDRIRPAAEEPELGIRVTPGSRTQLTSDDIVALVNDSPYPISWFGIFEITPQPRNEIAHRYRAIAQSFGIADQAWVHIAVSLASPAHPKLASTAGTNNDKNTVATNTGPAANYGVARSAAHNAVLDFLHHRLGLLGLRSRPLGTTELNVTLENEPTVVLRRPAGHSHSRRPHLWFTQAKSLNISPPPRQIVGIGSSGRALTVRLGEFQQITITAPTALATVPSGSTTSTSSAMTTGLPTPLRATHMNTHRHALSDLILPALVLGYRIGLYTHRPASFTELLDAGVTLLNDQQSPTVDVILHDELTIRTTIHRPSHALSTAAVNQSTRNGTAPDAPFAHAAKPTTLVISAPAGTESVEKRPLTSPEISLGEHQWTLELNGHATAVRPITVQAVAAHRAATNRQELAGSDLADPD